MASPMFETWGVDESPITIEYSLVVIEEIRQEVNQGLQQFARGGIEVGGVLYGTREGRTIRIKAMRPIHCEHKRGPSFVLSPTDREKLEAQLKADQNDPSLDGLICVGWFASHTRGDLALTDQDLEIFTTYFRDPWQATLIVRPGRSGSMRAAFFVWEPDMTVQSGKSYKEFNFPDRLAGVLDRGPRTPRADRERGQRAGFRTGGPGPEAVPPPEASVHPALKNVPPPASAPKPDTTYSDPMEPVPTPAYLSGGYQESSKAPWIVAILFLLAMAGAGGWYYYSGAAPIATPEPVDLVLVEREGMLEIEWAPDAPAVLSAVSGVLDITDGSSIEAVDLALSEIRSGRHLYARKTGSVEVRLRLMNANGVMTEELSRFVGQAPVVEPTEEVQSLEAERDSLAAEVQRLRQVNASQQEEIQRLERLQQVLENRLGIIEE